MRPLTILVILFSTTVYGQDAREIIKHYLDTVNANNWNYIKSTYTEAESYYSQSNYDQHPNLLGRDKAHFIKVYRLLPYNARLEIYEDSSFTNRMSTFYFSKNKTVVILGNTAPMVKPSSDRFFEGDIPIKISKLVQKSKSIKLVGIKEFPDDGVECYQIEILASKETFILYINKETLLLEYYTRRQDGDTSVLTRYFNYRQIGDFLIPMSSYTTRGGVVYYSINYRKYLINPDISPDVFISEEK